VVEAGASAADAEPAKRPIKLLKMPACDWEGSSEATIASNEMNITAGMRLFPRYILRFKRFRTDSDSFFTAEICLFVRLCTKNAQKEA